MTDKPTPVTWPILGLLGSYTKYVLSAYLIITMLVTWGFLLEFLRLTPSRTITPSTFVFIFWLTAVMVNTTIGTVVQALITEKAVTDMADSIAPRPQRVIIETRQGEVMASPIEE